MKDTIKAKVGYHLRKVSKNALDILPDYFKESDHEPRVLKDGDEFVLLGIRTSIDEMKAERDGNEMFAFYEAFTTEKGNHFIYWGDLETGDDYFTSVPADFDWDDLDDLEEDEEPLTGWM